MFNIILKMTGFEPQTSKIGINCSTNWATTTAKILHLFGSYKVRVKLVHTFDVLYITLVSIALHQLPMLRFTFMYKWPILKHFSTDSYNPHRYPHNGHIGHLFLYIKDKDTAFCVWLLLLQMCHSQPLFFIFVFSIQLTKGKQMFCIFANDCHNHCTLFYYFRHRALYNRRNFLHYIIPPFYVLFIIMKKNILLIVLNRLFLDNVKVEAFVYAEKILYVIKCIRNGG